MKYTTNGNEHIQTSTMEKLFSAKESRFPSLRPTRTFPALSDVFGERLPLRRGRVQFPPTAFRAAALTSARTAAMSSQQRAGGGGRAPSTGFGRSGAVRHRVAVRGFIVVIVAARIVVFLLRITGATTADADPSVESKNRRGLSPCIFLWGL